MGIIDGNSNGCDIIGLLVLPTLLLLRRDGRRQVNKMIRCHISLSYGRSEWIGR